MMDDVCSLERRRFLQQSTGAVALAAAGPVVAEGRARLLGVVVYRAEVADSRDFATAMQQQGMQAVALGDDVVRQWRDQLQALVVAQGLPLLGRTGYADWFMLRGLAAEHRLYPQHEQQPSTHSFDWVIEGNKA